MEKIAVVGAGLMGHGIAQVFALKGFFVGLTDINAKALESAVDNIRANLVLLADQGIIERNAVGPAVERILTTTDLAWGIGGADFVVEAAVENLKIKQRIFKELDDICPQDVILATNTSVISISEIAARTRHASRVIGAHFWNPPYLVPLVEVVRGARTSDAVMDRAMAILKAVGKHPVRVNKDVPGFVGNRLQHALWREAVSIVERGIADAATVDECVKLGFGLRLPVLGPLENADLVGTDLTLAIHDYLLKHLEHSPDPSPLLKEMVAREDLGFKTGRGFQPWSAEKIADTNNRLKTYLLKVNSWPKQKGGEHQ